MFRDGGYPGKKNYFELLEAKWVIILIIAQAPTY